MSFKTAQPKQALATPKAILRLSAISALVALALVALVVVGIRVRQNLASRSPVRIRGTISEADQTEILKLVRRDMWQRAFPGFSWAMIRRAPVSLFRIGTSRIGEILLAPQPSPYSIQVAQVGSAKWYWLLRRGPKGWVIESEQATAWFDVFEGRVEDLRAGIHHGKVQAPSLLQGPQGDLKQVPMLYVPPGSIPPRRPSGEFDGGASFSNWTSNRSSLSLGGPR